MTKIVELNAKEIKTVTGAAASCWGCRGSGGQLIGTGVKG